MISIVIPNRTKRWFHDWKSGVDLADIFPTPTYNVFGVMGGTPFGSWSAIPGGPEHIDLTGLQEQIGVSIPITSGQYLGLSRSGLVIVPPCRSFGREIWKEADRNGCCNLSGVPPESLTAKTT